MFFALRLGVKLTFQVLGLVSCTKPYGEKRTSTTLVSYASSQSNNTLAEKVSQRDFSLALRQTVTQNDADVRSLLGSVEKTTFLKVGYINIFCA